MVSANEMTSSHPEEHGIRMLMINKNHNHIVSRRAPSALRAIKQTKSWCINQKCDEAHITSPFSELNGFKTSRILLFTCGLCVMRWSSSARRAVINWRLVCWRVLKLVFLSHGISYFFGRRTIRGLLHRIRVLCCLACFNVKRHKWHIILDGIFGGWETNSKLVFSSYAQNMRSIRLDFC